MVGRKSLIDEFEPFLLEFLYFSANWTLFHLYNLLLDVVGKIDLTKVEQIELLLFSLHFLPLMMLFKNMFSLYFVFSTLYFLTLVFLGCVKMITIVSVMVEDDNRLSCSELYWVFRFCFVVLWNTILLIIVLV